MKKSVPFTQRCFVKSLVEIGPLILEIFFNFVDALSLFRYYLPLGKNMTLHLDKLESSSPKDALFSLVALGLVVLERNSKI